MVSYTREELLKIKASDITHNDDKTLTIEAFKKLQSGEPVIQFQKRYIKKNGDIIWVSISSAAVRGVNKEPLYVVTNTQDITEQKKWEAKLLELDHAKNEFLTLTSHQLRTPLSAIKWVLESMLGDETLSPKQEDKLNDLVISNERLINLVNRLLNVTRIESGKLVVKKDLVDIKKLVDKLVVSLNVLAEKKNKKINVIIPNNFPSVFCDSILINEGLEDLIRNAIDYSKEGQNEIIVTVSEEKNNYLFSVHNKGVIDKAAVERIGKFDKFSRESDASKATPSGSGLGLYITKKLIEASGGTMYFESDEASDTTFYFTLAKDMTNK
jgi:PAS domain S-box-containing protein